MKLIKPSFEILEQLSGIEGIFKHIERIGRVCYKSEENITDSSYIQFVEMLKNRKHGAMLEHGTVYLKLPFYEVGMKDCYNLAAKYESNRYSVVEGGYVTTNYRVLVENNWSDDLQYQCEPTEYHEKRYSVKFICCRGVSHEFVRNRGSKGNAFAQESTRYCNYSKDKYGNKITFIIPCWAKNIKAEDYENNSGLMYNANGTLNECEIRFCISLYDSEKSYFYLLEQGWLPQQAREVLPNALKTELVMTCFKSDWKHFLSLKADKAAHPQAQELAYPLKDEFERRGWL